MLNEFRVQTITWDKANSKIYEIIKASQGDSNGRKLRVQILDNGEAINLSGSSLSLAWKSITNKGLDKFELVDANKGLFEIFYTTEMLSTSGKITASLVLIDSVGRLESDPFSISISRSIVDDDSVQSDNSFTALTEALVKVTDLEGNYAPRLNEVTAQLAQTAKKGEIISSDLSTSTDAGKIKLINLSDEVHQALTGDAPALGVIADKSVTVEKVGFLSLTRQNLYNPAASTVGSFINEGTGGLSEGASYKASDYMPVKPNAEYYTTLNMNIAFYNKDKVFISGVQGGWGTDIPSAERYVLLTPNDPSVAYVRVTTTLADKTFIFAEGREKMSPYVPYGDYTISISDSKLADEIERVAKQNSKLRYEKQSINLDALQQISIEITNLMNPAEFISNSAIHPSTGNVYEATNYTASGFSEVEPDTNYRINQTHDYAWYDANKDFISGKYGGWTQEVLTSPSNAKYLRATLNPADTGMLVKGDVLPNFIAYTDPMNISIKFTSEEWRSRFSKALGLGDSGRLGRLKWNVLGDSITYGSGAEGFPYHKWIADRTGITVTNYGISMSTVSDMVGNRNGYDSEDYTPMVYRYQDMADDADVITVMAGTNDIGHGAPLGVMGDTGTHTFYGALDTLLKGLINKYPTKSIGYILPPSASPTLDETSRDNTFIKAIKELCQLYGIPVLDLYSGNQLGGRVQARKDIFVPDGLHPSKYGHEKLSFAIEQFLLTIV